MNRKIMTNSQGRYEPSPVLTRVSKIFILALVLTFIGAYTSKRLQEVAQYRKCLETGSLCDCARKYRIQTTVCP